MQIVLGSGSPRRKELLQLMGYEFIIDPPQVDENVTDGSPIEIVKKIVAKKGIAALKKHPEDLVICADTIVVYKSQILGKPKDKDDARRMIKLLSNNKHYVLTAVFVSLNNRIETFVESTKVYVDKLTDEEIEEYINSPEPYDKAGAYGIQGIFSKYIKKINGDYYNVMGLPVNKTYNLIKNMLGD